MNRTGGEEGVKEPNLPFHLFSAEQNAPNISCTEDPLSSAAAIADAVGELTATIRKSNEEVMAELKRMTQINKIEKLSERQCQKRKSSLRWKLDNVDIGEMRFFDTIFLTSVQYEMDYYFRLLFSCMLLSFHENFKCVESKWLNKNTIAKLRHIFPEAYAVSPLSLLLFSEQPFVRSTSWSGPVASCMSKVYRLFYHQRVVRTRQSCQNFETATTSRGQSSLPGWISAFGTENEIMSSLNTDFNMLERGIKKGGKANGKRKRGEKPSLQSEHEREYDGNYDSLLRLKAVQFSRAKLQSVFSDSRNCMRMSLYSDVWFFIDYIQDLQEVPVRLHEGFFIDIPTVSTFLCDVSNVPRTATMNKKTDEFILETDTRNDGIFEKTKAEHPWLLLKIHYYRKVVPEEGENFPSTLQVPDEGIWMKEMKQIHLYDVADRMLIQAFRSNTRHRYMRCSKNALRCVHIVAYSLHVILRKATNQCSLNEEESTLARFVTPYLSRSNEHVHSLMFGSMHAKKRLNSKSNSMYSTLRNSRRLIYYKEYALRSGLQGDLQKAKVPLISETTPRNVPESIARDVTEMFADDDDCQ